jgi:NAD-dependent deacetylase
MATVKTMPRVVVFTGAGISAESGLQTYRDKGGLWDEYPLHEVATPEAWQATPERVLTFYTLRRRLVRQAQPNAGHRALVDLQQHAQVRVITQNIDDLHERAGSTQVLHLHGEIFWGRSSIDPACREYLGERDIAMGDKAADGSPLRPDVVWFGEPVPAMAQAVEWLADADVLLIVGTSLAVYPAASLVELAPRSARRVIIDPAAEEHAHRVDQCLPKPASQGLLEWVAQFAQGRRLRKH